MVRASKLDVRAKGNGGYIRQSAWKKNLRILRFPELYHVSPDSYECAQCPGRGRRADYSVSLVFKLLLGDQINENGVTVSWALQGQENPP